MVFDSAAGICYASIFLLVQCILHPELKVFYSHGGGNMKNTTSFIDSAVAAAILSLGSMAARQVSPRSPASKGIRPLLGKVSSVFLPAAGVFCVILLSTLANYLSFKVWVALGPVDLVFTVIFAWYLQGVAATRMELSAVALAIVGSLAFVAGELHASKADDSTVVLAIVVTLCCRAVQGLQTVLLRNACRRLSAGSRSGQAVLGEKQIEAPALLHSSVIEISALKMCIVASLCLPYALLTEGLAPWHDISSSHFWDTKQKGWLLCGSVIITTVFQLCSVGMSSEASSITVSLLMTSMSPIVNVLFALLLVLGGSIGQAMSRVLGVKPSAHVSASEAFGLCLLVAAAICYGFAQRSRLQRHSGLLARAPETTETCQS